MELKEPKTEPEQLGEPLVVSVPDKTIIPKGSKVKASNIEADTFVKTPREAPTQDYQVVNKKYVDDLIAAL